MRLLALMAGVLLAAHAAAQVVPPAADPGAAQQRQIEEERRRQELERLQRKPITDPLKTPPADKPAVQVTPSGLRFLVREIEFTASEILSRDELEKVAREFRGKELSLADLQQLAERVNGLYRAKGVVTARALIPPQDVSQGVVRVRLVEGRIGRTQVDGNASTSDSYIVTRLAQEPGQLVDLAGLEQALVRFNRTTDVQLSAELKPGARFGTTDIHLHAQEPPRQSARVFADNGGSEATGTWRQGLSYLNRSLLGLRDDLSLSAQVSNGHGGFSLAYGVPLNRWGGRATLAFYRDDTEIIRGAAAPLAITGRSASTTLTWRQPLHVGQNIQVDAFGGLKKREASNDSDGVLLDRTRTADASLGVELQGWQDTRSWLASYAVSSGHADSTTRVRYTIGRGSIRGSQAFGGGWTGSVSLAFQHRNGELLPSGEQFFIGGEGTVRGYPVGAYSGDQGYAASLELHHPLPLSVGLAPDDLVARGFFFVDHGQVRPFRPSESTLRPYDRLAAAGWGLSASLMKRTAARLTWAYALNQLPHESRRYRIHFQVVASVD